MGETGWKSELSLLDEFFGKEPRYPLATEVEHQSYEFHKQNEILRELSSQQQTEIRNTTSQICGSLENGFGQLYEVNQKGFETITNAIESGTEELSGQLNEANRSLEQIEATLQWGFSSLINQLTITNKKLNQIIHLLNIPDSQKQRKYHIEQGFDFLRKSQTNSFFFAKAKENFLKVIDIEDSDYLSLQQLGIIHLYSKDEMNLTKSADFLKKSITYSQSEINFTRNSENSSSFHFTYNPSKITATSLLHLARYYYVIEDYKNALETAKKGINIYPLISQFYDLSIYSSHLMQEKESVEYLNKAISMDRYISVKVLSDKQLITKPYINNYLNNLRENTNRIVTEKISELKSLAHQNSVYKSTIEEIENLSNKKQYLSSLKALEKIGYELEN